MSSFDYLRRHSWVVFLTRHSELLLVVGILLVVSAVFHWIPLKFGFLSFFYLPVLAAGYLFGARRAVLTGVTCVLLVVLYYVWLWTSFELEGSTLVPALLGLAAEQWETLANLAMWGGFLILIGGLSGSLHERMISSYQQVQELNQTLEGQAAQLTLTNEALQASSNELTHRAEELQEKNLLVEQLRKQLEDTLFSTMDATVARLSIQGRLREEKRQIAVLFCDLQGFTTYSQMLHPEVVLDDLNRFYAVMEELIERYHGHIDKYMGDGIMCEFGAPIDHQQFSLQAVVTALKMQEKFRTERFPWKLRVGIASGETIVALLGTRRKSYSAIGEVVNVAKRLEELCEPGAVFIDETTYAAVRHFAEVDTVRSLGRRRDDDKKVLDTIAEKKQFLDRNPRDPDLLFDLGKLYFELREPSPALDYFRRAMELDPENSEIKVWFADASVKKDEFEKISIPGLTVRRAVYRVTGLRNPLLDRNRFPQSFYDQYRRLEDLIEIPEDITLPTEVIDATVGHSKGVAVLAYALADRLEVGDDLKRKLLIAGRLQDLGKSAIWHHILNRRGGLSDTERKELEAHVAESISLAKRLGYDDPHVIGIIAAHHELLNGEGYPNHLKGEQIPLAARIGCVADVYCAFTGWRPYREPWDRRIVLNELRKDAAAGKYDPKVVDALVELVS